MASKCIIHQGYCSSGGYGRVHLPDGRYIHAHRHAFEKAFGPIPKGMLVCHKCDNPPCINLDHLFLGTHQDNSDDMVAKGRSLVGEKQHKSHLTEVKVISIREKYSQGMTAVAVGEEFNISCDYVTRIVSGHVWKYLQLSPEKNFGSKVTPKVAKEIRKRVASGEMQKIIAENLSLSTATISRVVNGITAKVGVSSLQL